MVKFDSFHFGSENEVQKEADFAPDSVQKDLFGIDLGQKWTLNFPFLRVLDFAPLTEETPLGGQNHTLKSMEISEEPNPKGTLIGDFRDPKLR